MSTPQSGTPQPNPILQAYQAWSERTPYVTKTVTLGLVILYILSFFISLELYLSDIPFFAINHFEIYRLFCSPFVGNSIFLLILIIITFPSIGSKIENTTGSSSFLFLLCLMNLCVNISFNFICYLFYFMNQPEFLFYDCSNFWVILFALITIDCMQVPDAPRRLLFIPYDIPSMYMPLALYFLICIFEGFQLSYALSILVGYMSQKGYLDRFKPSSYYFEQLESANGWLHSISRSRGWVLAGASLGHDAWIPVNTVDPDMRADRQQNQQSSFGSSFQSASSSQGAATHPEAPSQAHPFPGSGRKLSNESGSGGMFSFSSNASSHANTNSSSSSMVPSREELASRRLAALESQINKV